MSDRVATSYHSCDGKAAQSINPYQSAWMAHWAGTSSDGSPHMHHRQSGAPRNMGSDVDIKQHQLTREVDVESFISRSAKGCREVETRTSKLINESLATSSKTLTSERLGSQSFPIFKLCENIARNSISKNDINTSAVQALRPQVSHKELPASSHVVPGPPFATATSSRECHFQPGGVLQIPAEEVKYHMFFGESSYSSTRPSKEKFSGSACHMRPDHGEYKFDSGTSAVPSFMRRHGKLSELTPIFESKEKMSKTNLTILEQEHSNYHSHSALLVCEEKMNNFPKHEKSVTPFLRQSSTAHPPSTSSKRSTAFGEEQYQMRQNQFGRGFFPSESGYPEMTNGKLSLQSFPNFQHDVETMRICTSTDSAQGLAGDLPGFSQTTHSLLITKHTNVKFCKENQIVSESSVSTQLKAGSAFNELHNTSLPIGHGQEGVKLQLLGSSTDSEEKENLEGVKTSAVVQKNESSAETDTMDMESFKEKNHLSGGNSSSSNKDIMVETKPVPQATTALAAEQDPQRKRINELPDINLEIPAMPAASSSYENAEPCASRTQSLDMEALLFHVDQPSKSQSSDCLEVPMGPEPSSRWIKRLKLDSSNLLALGTKSSKLSEASHEKMSKFFKIMKGDINSSEPTLGKHHGKGSTLLDHKTGVSRKGESSYVETGKEGHDITLSHSWIQRWRHNQARKKPETVVTCEPHSSKLEDFQKRQFPSIAAMALMGKAMTGFQQCEFQRRDSFVVWNTKNF